MGLYDKFWKKGKEKENGHHCQTKGIEEDDDLHDCQTEGGEIEEDWDHLKGIDQDDDDDQCEKIEISNYDIDPLEIVTSVREAPPSHYILKIESFSFLSQLLQETGDDKYESNDFEAGGYKWRLLLYPNGKKKSDANGHISLYLARSETKKPTCGEVNVIIKFFVFDQIREKYLTLEEKRLRPFNALKTERGIPRLLSLTTLKDPSNGYLIDDCCIFGVEVFVVKSEGKGESFSIIKEPDDATFTWKVDEFSGLKNHFYIRSQVFTVGGRQWKLSLYPNGDLSHKGKSLSLFLHLQEYSDLRPGWKLNAHFKLSIKDQVHGEHYERTHKNWFCSSNLNRGYPDFILLSDLKDKKKGFIINDTLIVEGKITFTALVNRFA